MTFKELIEQINCHGPVAVNCKHFIVRNLSDWVRINTERVDRIKRAGIDPAKSAEAKGIKRNAQYIFDALQDPKNIHPAGWLPERQFSIFPLDI